MASPTVRHRLPVINGFVSVPDGQILYPTTLTPQDVLSAIAGSSIIRIGPGGAEELSGIYSVNNDDTQRTPRTTIYVELPAFDAPGQQGSDYFAQLRALAAAQ